jgi:hypothetical protein
LSEKLYTVRVWDNFHYMEEDEAYNHGTYETYEEALAAAKTIVEDSLQECAPNPNNPDKLNADELYHRYVLFGDDPGIMGPPGTPHFSAWNYAKARSGEIFPAKPTAPP